MIPFLKRTKYFFVLILISFIAGCSSDNDDNLPAVEAAFTYFIDGTTGTVEFTNTSTNANSYFWDLGNGNTTTEENPIDTYTSGEYIITLEASNVSGGTATITATIVINIAEPLTLGLPINFDDDLNLDGITTFDTSFQVIDNPQLSGVNDTASKVGEIKSNGVQYQGITLTLDTPVDFSGSNKTIQLKMYSTIATDFLVKFSKGIDNARDVEVKVAHTGSGWELMNFDFATNGVKSFIDGDSENGQSFVPTGQYEQLDIFVAFEGGDIADTFYIDDIMQTDSGGVDATAPVITLNGEATMNITVGGTFEDPGATASDNVDGDITANIVVGGDTVDTNTAGTYVITYNVSDTAGNAATEVTRTVTVSNSSSFDDGLLTNGDFESGDDSWTGNALNVITEGGNSFNFANVETAGNAYDVNLSQVIEIVQGSTYKLSFDASSDGTRTMIAGIGLNEDPFTSATEEVNLTTETQTYTLTLTATDFGSANSRVLFDMGADTGVVVIDNVSLFLADTGGDTTAPVITLNGEATMNIMVGVTFEDPGATASDDIDGNITADIIIGGDTVDTNTAGTYVITYNVSDEAGNAAVEVTRTVVVSSTTNEPVTAAPTPPTRDAADVISLFSDAYSNITVSEWSTGWDDADIEDFMAGGNVTKKITFGNQNGGFLGVDFSANAFDATSMTHFHMDYWIADEIATGQILNPKWSNHDGGAEVNAFEYTNPVNQSGQWISIDIPITDFGGDTLRDNVAQFILATGNTLNEVYVDNIYFYKEGSGGGGSQDDIISIFSDDYTNIAVNEWGPNWGDSSSRIIDGTLEGSPAKIIKVEADQVFAGIDFSSAAFDATDFTTFHMDYKVDPLLAGQVVVIKLSNHDGGNGETGAIEYTSVPSDTNVVSLAIPLSDFTDASGSGDLSRNAIAQIVITAARADGSQPVDVYLDNIYFSK